MHAPSTPARPPRGLFGNAYLLLALAALCWSGNHVLVRASAGQVPPFALTTSRWLIPALLLWPFALPHLRRDWPQMVAHWRSLTFLGLTGGALFGALQYLGLQYTTALNVSVLNSLSPVLIVAASAAIFKDRITGVQMLGVGISLCGVLVIVTQLDVARLAALQFNVGDLIIVFNMAVWAVYSASLRLRPQIHWLSFIYVLAAIGGFGTLPLWVWEYASGHRLQPTLITVVTVGYVAVFASVVAFVAWNRGIELIGATRASPFLHLVALYSAVLASVFLGEHLQTYHLLGFGLILGGVILTARRKAAPAGAIQAGAP